MKTIGLLGGMSWESTAAYYRSLNEDVKERLGGLHSAKIAMVSVDFGPIEKLMQKGAWGTIAQELSRAAHKIETAGADFLLICTNTMHKVFGAIEAAVHIPVIHIADATAERLIEQGIKTAGLLGTAFTMEHDFYKGRLREKYGLEVLVPNKKDRQIVHDVIFNELCLGKVESSSRSDYLRIIAQLVDQGAQAVILGCTEIGLLVQPEDTRAPLFDTTAIHAQKAVAVATANRS